MKRLTLRLVAAATAIVILFVSSVTATATYEKPALYGKSRLSLMDKGETLVKAYDRIFAGIEECSDKIYLVDLSIMPKQLEAVMEAYGNDPSDHFWFEGEYSYSHYVGGSVTVVEPHYNSLAESPEVLLENRKLFMQSVNGILERADLTPDMSEFERVHILHDLLVGETDYNDTANAHNVFGAIVEHRAVCEGYAKAFQYLLSLCGIQAHTVSGTANGGPHAWNILRIDGEYYHTDVTWDDPLGGRDDLFDVYHAYMNLTAKQMAKDHSWNEPAYGLDDCKSTAASLYTQEPNRKVGLCTSNAILASLFKNGHAHVRIVDDEELFLYQFFNSAWDIAALAGYDLSKPLYVSCSNNNGEYRLTIDGQLTDKDDDPKDAEKGDVDLDSKLTAKDSNYMKRIIVGTYKATATQMSAADLNGDSRVDVRDSNLLKRKLSGN